jgi:hypothetical protein
VGNQIWQTLNRCPVHVGWLRMWVRPSGSQPCTWLQLGERSVPCLCPGLWFRVCGKSDWADAHALGRAGWLSKDVGLAAGQLAVKMGAVGSAPRAWHWSRPVFPRWAGRWAVSRAHVCCLARNTLCHRPGLLFRVCGKSDLSDPHALGCARWLCEGAGQAAGQFAMQMAAAGVSLRARHRSRPFVPSR